MKRRAVLGLAGALGLSACASTEPTSGGDPTQIDDGPVRITWWGSNTRTENTTEMIDLFKEARPDARIDLEPSADTGYTDRLATQVASGDAADVMQFSINYLKEYSSRGALMDLNTIGLDVNEFAPGTLDSGRVDDHLYAIATGVNAPTILANPAVFEQAGIDLPDDSSWTWEDYLDTAARVTAATPDGVYGSGCLWIGPDTMLNAWLRQHGKSGIFTGDGLAFGPEDIVGFYELLEHARDIDAIPSGDVVAEESTKPIEQQQFATGRMALSLTYSNVIALMDTLTEQDVQLLRAPAVPAAPQWAWYATAMQWAVSATSESPELAGELVKFLVSSPDAGLIQMTDRGVPSHVAVRAAVADQVSASDKKGLDFIAELEPDLGPPSPIPVPGGSSITSVYGRHSQSVLNGTASAQEAAEALTTEMDDAIKRAQ